MLTEAAWSGGSPVGEKAYVPGLAEVDMWSTPSYAYLTHDHLGSTRGMWDGSIAQLGSWEFDPYGSPFHFAGPAGVTQLYTGHDLDAVTGQYYAPFRYLDPAIGRWMSQDPLHMINGSNMHSYVLNNPVNFVDLDGRNALALAPLIGTAVCPGLGTAIGIGVLVVGTWAGYRYFQSRGREADLPSRGEPNSSDVVDRGDGRGTIRDYDADGRAERDYDFGHDHGAGDPHAHDWDWTKPRPVRKPGRPLKPNE